MKIAIITANIGDIDEVKAGIEQRYSEQIQCNYFCFTREHPLLQDATLQSYNDRLLSRYPKFMAHKLLPDYDIYIWLDARVQPISSEFIDFMIDKLEDIKIAVHPDRKTIGEEVKHITERLQNNDEYLTARKVTLEMMEKQNELIKGNIDTPLYCTRVFSYVNNEKNNQFNEAVWKSCFELGPYEQIFWSYEAERLGLKINSFIETDNSYYKFDEHKILK